eukprot:TRINITY_DN756_c0_g1_i3.p1 TRINITY_DN756_c0_g1~~TRINITY_DN756_c0_g1_i3.p1  ORF type:complete len:168 (+),score=36.03 TRINITY_DN756_c0_g1_i3:405-908(+)
MLYLAAAVSDFYVPHSEMATHKIQSDHGPLRLELPNTPKILGLVREEWAPHALMVSFKLETDPDLVVPKALRAIHKYGVHAVVANQLATRHQQVILVQAQSQEVITRQPDHTCLEQSLIPRLKTLHQEFLAAPPAPISPSAGPRSPVFRSPSFAYSSSRPGLSLIVD